MLPLNQQKHKHVEHCLSGTWLHSLYIYIYMSMGSNPGQPDKKFVKNDFTNQVKFELSTLRHDL